MSEEMIMKFILDMLHHNPGEAPFDTKFSDPGLLKQYGYNGQVFKHLNCVARFDETGLDLFPEGSDEDAWLQGMTEHLQNDIHAAKEAGLQVFSHIDLFVLPSALVEACRDELVDEDGRISLSREKTMEIHRVMFKELVTRFPEVDGFIIRVGETYLYDTPYHTGNGAVRYGEEPTASEQDEFVKLIDFLRTEICEELDRWCLFRTWDCLGDRFHANPVFYRGVTDRIEPHPKLVFSIKHTALDFWRRVKFNECLGIGNHPQIVEVQCQREYEGKGAFPNYVMDGVIDGFDEVKNPVGIQSLAASDSFLGVYGWSRGGGWYGPYLKDELWCDLHVYVLSHWASDPEASEKELFLHYWTQEKGMDAESAALMRTLAKEATEGLLKGRYCEVWDKLLGEIGVPAGLWMRDDILGGMVQLRHIFEYLDDHHLTQKALDEKAAAVAHWIKARECSSSVTYPDEELRSAVVTSTEYGLRLFRLVEAAWRMMAEGLQVERKKGSKGKLREYVSDVESFWAAYEEMREWPKSATLYRGAYRTLPDEPPKPGLQDTFEMYKKITAES